MSNLATTQNKVASSGAISLSPAKLPHLWDTFFIGPLAWPGIARVRGRKGNKADIKRIPGADAAQLTSLGYDPGQVDVDLIICDPPGTSAQWDFWEKQLVPLLYPKKRLPLKPFDVFYPSLHALRIRKLWFLDAEAPQQQRVPGDILIVRMRFMHFEKVKSRAVNTAQTSVPTPTKGGLAGLDATFMGAALFNENPGILSQVSIHPQLHGETLLHTGEDPSQSAGLPSDTASVLSNPPSASGAGP
ncbi:MAG: hypothetical protein ACYDCP_07165 [Thermoplasmataceae archaeon]